MAQQGAQAKMAFKTGTGSQTWDAGTTGDERFIIFNTENLSLQQDFVEAHGVRGTRGRHINRRVAGAENVAGTITLNPTPNDLLSILYYTMGVSRDGSDNITFGETLPAFGVLIDRVTDVMEYKDCKIETATFSASAGGLLESSLNIVGGGEDTGESFPAFTGAQVFNVSANDNQPLFFDPTITLDGGAADAINVNDWSLTISNQLAVRFGQERSPANIEAEDRVITMSFTAPWDSTLQALLLESSGSTGLSGANTMVFDGAGNAALTFTMHGLKSSKDAATVSGREEIMRTCEFTVLSKNTTNVASDLDFDEMYATLVLDTD